MAKYIRTKDGIYEVYKEFDDEEYKKGYLVNTPPSKWEYDEDTGEVEKDSKKDGFWEREVVKKSDDIKDLCDVFIVEHEYYGKLLMYINFTLEEAKKNLDVTKGDTLYGALKIKGQGVIYKAKMNNEGNLELL